MAVRKTVEDFGLVRDEGEGSKNSARFAFSEPFTGPNGERKDWQPREIYDPKLLTVDMLVYAYNATTKTLVVFGADLKDEFTSKRHTEVRLWEMLADCWTATGNDAGEFSYVGFALVVNDDVRAAMDEEWAREARGGRQRE